MIKDILLVLDDVGERASPYTLSLARKFGAHTTVISTAPEQTFETMAFAEVRFELVAAAQDALEERAAAVKHRFIERADRADLMADGLTICGMATIVEEQVIALGRLRDLCVIEQREPDRPKPADRFIEPLLLKTGRPTLIVPFIQDLPAALDRVTVAWDGSATAARALADSIPFLQHATYVEVLSVETGNVQGNEVEGERIVRHLARHGVEASARSISSTLSVADTLLSHVADHGSDLLVMGAYGHSRLREAILGGASRDILRTMTLPVLMSH